jgi:hypothetical protein
MTKNEIPFDFGDEIFVFKLTDGNLFVIPTEVRNISDEYINGNWNIWQCFHREEEKQALMNKIAEWIINPKLTYKELFNLKD